MQQDYKCVNKISMRGSRNFCQGGSRPEGQKTALTHFILHFRGGPTNGFITFITEKTILFQGSRGGPTFSVGGGGVQLFPGGGGGGPNANFYRNPYNL